MKKILLLGIIGALLIGCGQPQKAQVKEEVAVTYENKAYKKFIDTSDIKNDIDRVNKKLKSYYTKYLAYKAPNGKPIYIVAADKVSDEQLLKAYNVLDFYLSKHKTYDMDKVANNMADTGAILMMPNGADGKSDVKDAMLFGQPLYQNETPVTGSKWYLENDYNHRDASYEEIVHMVHDNGIGTQSNAGVLPDLQKTIYAATMNALPKDQKDWGTKGLWGLQSKDWLVELSKEGSLEQEYLASVLDSYYGLWSAFQEEGGMWGLYVAKDRAEIKDKDPKGFEMLESFLPKYMTMMERVSPDFKGTFYMSLDKSLAYTYKSQYLLNLRLTGKENSHITANDQDNVLYGNAGNNVIDGKEGHDVVYFTGQSSEYEITSGVVKDTKGRDGTDTLKNIEVLRFTDKDINIKDAN